MSLFRPTPKNSRFRKDASRKNKLLQRARSKSRGKRQTTLETHRLLTIQSRRTIAQEEIPNRSLIRQLEEGESAAHIFSLEL